MNITTYNKTVRIDDTAIPKNGFIVRKLAKSVRLDYLSTTESIDIYLDNTIIDGVPAASLEQIFEYFIEQGFISGGGSTGEGVDLSEYEKTSSVNQKLSLKADKTQLNGLATEQFVTNAINNNIPNIDLSEYEKTIDVDNKISNLESRFDDIRGLEYDWNGTALGVRKDGEEIYSYVDLKGADGTMSFADLTEEQRESLRGLKGDPGEQGQDGQDGKDFTYADFTPEQLNALKGAQGEKGADGYTPIKGVDYFDGEKGEKGERGEKGDKGDQGIQGVRGVQGEKGERGDGFNVVKTYTSIAEMEADFLNTEVKEGDLVMIATDETNEDNARVYAKDSTGFTFIVDLSGVQGIRGEKGERGEQGVQGLQGAAGRDAEVTSASIQSALGYIPANNDLATNTSTNLTNHTSTSNFNAHSIDNITGLREIVDSLDPSKTASWNGSLNDINKTCWVLAEANITSDKPVGAYNFYVYTIHYNSTHSLQVAYLSTGSESFDELIYTRRKVSGVWLSWTKLLTEKDFKKTDQDYIPYLGNLKDINYNAKVYAHGVVPDRPITRTSFYIDVIVRGDNTNYRLLIARPIDDTDEYYLRMINGVWQEWKKYPHQHMKSGSPEGVQTALVGTFYTNTANGDLYYKQTGTGNTGWKKVTLV